MENAALIPPHPGPDTISLMGLRVAAVSERETIDYVLHGLANRRGNGSVPSTSTFCDSGEDDPDVRDLMSGADMIVADGMPLVWAGGLKARRSRSNWPGPR